MTSPGRDRRRPSCGDLSGNGLPDIVDRVLLGRQLVGLQAAVLLFERCDGEDLNGTTCESLGHEYGYLTCRPTCARDASGCYPTLLAIAVGDSLVHDLAPGEATSPAQGWMHALPPHFATGELVFEDPTQSGASTKSFRDLGYREAALAAAPRWILVEFGHNDARPGSALHTIANTTYRANLHAMVVEARAIGAEPIFVTLSPFFYYAQDGFPVARPNGLEIYGAAMHAQAEEGGVSVVELHAPPMDAYGRIGITLARSLYSYEDSRSLGAYLLPAP